MTDARKALGTRGEDLATAFFIQKGFRLVTRNWRCRLGEIDLIVEKEGVVHFIEVKTRRTLTYGRPEEAINGLKLRHIERTVEAYIAAAKQQFRGYQVDALAIMILPNNTMEYSYIEQIL